MRTQAEHSPKHGNPGSPLNREPRLLLVMCFRTHPGSGAMWRGALGSPFLTCTRFTPGTKFFTSLISFTLSAGFSSVSRTVKCVFSFLSGTSSSSWKQPELAEDTRPGPRALLSAAPRLGAPWAQLPTPPPETRYLRSRLGGQEGGSRRRRRHHPHVRDLQRLLREKQRQRRPVRRRTRAGPGRAGPGWDVPGWAWLGRAAPRHPP